MKHFTLLLFFLTVSSSFAQDNSLKFKSEILQSPGADTADIRKQVSAFNLGAAFIGSNNTQILGFIGADYQRLWVKLISVIKNNNHPNQYFIYGKTMVKDNVCDFQGTLSVTDAHFYKNAVKAGIKQGFILGDYTFFESQSQKHVGQFKGVFCIDFYIEEGKINYGILTPGSYNSFVGSWTSYNGKLTKECNWSEERIPMCGDLDIGAGIFWPSEKYVNNGWLNYILAQKDMDPRSVQAKKKENEEWWK